MERYVKREAIMLDMGVSESYHWAGNKDTAMDIRAMCAHGLDCLSQSCWLEDVS
jgi:hypothetical protein